MNRFKFRIWDKKNNNWIKTRSFHLNHSGELVWNRIESSPNGQDDFVIQQWTGLVDSNGKDIYVGDISRVHRWKDGQNIIDNWYTCIEIAEIIFLNGAFLESYDYFRYDDIVALTPGHRHEIIGNIFETPIDSAKSS